MACFRSSSECWFNSLKRMYWALKPLSRRKSERALQQVFGVDAEIVAGVRGIVDPFHGVAFS